MEIEKSKNFKDDYLELPLNVRTTAERKIELFMKNPQHPSLRVKKIGNIFSLRVNTNYRIVYREVAAARVRFLFIGPHDQYLRFIQKFQ